MEETSNKESVIRKVLFNEVSFILAVCGVVISIALWILGPQQENKTAIALLQQQLSNEQNRSAEITKVLQNDTQEVKANLKEVKDNQRSIMDGLIKLQTTLELHLKKE